MTKTNQQFEAYIEERQEEHNYTTEEYINNLEIEVDRLQSIVNRLRMAKLTQTAWEADEDVVLLNNKPVGGTITKRNREFERWWPAVKREILGENNE